MLYALTALALAQDLPTEAEVQTWSADQYTLWFLENHHVGGYAEDGRLLQASLSPDPQLASSALEARIGHAQQRLEQAQAMPPYQDDDRLRQGAILFWSAVLAAEPVHAELDQLVRQAEVRAEDLARAEELAVQRHELWDAAMAEMVPRMHAFNEIWQPEASSLGALDPRPELNATKPEGSRLATAEYLSFALRYQDQLLAHRHRYGVHLADFSSTMHVVNVDQPAQLALVRAELLEDLEEARALEPWQGDAGLRDALVELGEALLLVLDGPYVELLPLLDPPSPFGKRRREAKMSEVAARIGHEMTLAYTAFDAEAEAFAQRWHLEDYLSWQEAFFGERRAPPAPSASCERHTPTPPGRR